MIEILNIFEDIDSHLLISNISYMDAILHWCEIHSIEIEHITPILTSNNIAIARLRRDAETLNFLKREIRIPI